MNSINIEYFEQLRQKINDQLRAIGAKYAQRQIEQYPFLYGALGAVPSSVMFICENPSLAGVKQASVQTIDGGPPDIEIQWWASPSNNAAKRFRVVLCELGLKTTPPAARGGWQCYITNVIKELNIADHQNNTSSTYRNQQAREWSEILRWEFDKVQPQNLFCVGGEAFRLIKILQRESLLPKLQPNQIMHYSARNSDAHVIERMKSSIIEIL